MLRQSKKLLLGGFFGLFSEENDPYTITEDVIEQRRKEFEDLMPTTGWERVKYGLWSKNKYGERTPFVYNLVHCTLTSAVLGAFYGGYQSAQVAYLDFMRTNQATAFLTHMDAKRRLQDRIMVSFLKGGAKLAWRTGLFSFLFIGMSNSIALYRNKDGILEYALGGAAGAAVYRMHIGLRQAIVGSILGLGFGGAAGCLSYSVLKLTGHSMTDVKYIMYSYSLERARFVLQLF